ncbi:MAG: LysM peptidoglycan-binding domain-containing protein [Actinomycetota bacterium]|nr:LysM peptidoglycan-binding domain-containing protein [Actinomycetota bacterium]
MGQTYLTITPVTPPGAPVSVNLVGPAPLTQVGGSAGWQLVDRPRNKTATMWYGSHIWQIVVPILLDKGGPSIEADFNTINSWDAPGPGQQRPPVLKLTGPVPREDLAWVLQTIAWDEAADKVIRDANGTLTQASGTLTFYEFSDLTYSMIGAPSPAQAAQVAQAAVPAAPGAPKPAPSTSHTYTVRSGDTLSAIAAAKLGDYRKWPAIAQANHLRDPNFILPGQILVLP